MTIRRDWLVDLLRVGAMGVVVLMHWTLMRVTMPGGRLTMDIALHGPWALAATWVLQVMPLFFVCGGFANAVTYDKVAPLIAAENPELEAQIRRELTGVVGFVEDLEAQEEAGTRFTPEQADQFGAELQSRATALAGQITQAAALLGVTIEE